MRPIHVVITRRERLDVPDGINTSIFTLGKELRRLGHKVSFVSTYHPDLEKMQLFYDISEFDIYGLLAPSFTFPQPLWKVLHCWLTDGINLIRQLKPDLVILNGAIPFFPRDIPHVFVAHDLEHRMVRSIKLQNIIKKISYGTGFALVATTTEVKEGLINELSLPYDRVVVIPTCINLENYKCQELRFRKKAILHIGTEPYKNPRVTIEAFQYIQDLEFECLIVGKITDELERIITSIKNKNARLQIHLLGRVTDYELKELLGSVWVVSVPSLYKSPVASPTVLEALASGTPVVTTKSVSRDIAIDGISCLIRDPTPIDFAEALRALAKDYNLWTHISNNARKIASKFDSKLVARQYLDLYNTYKKTNL